MSITTARLTETWQSLGTGAMSVQKALSAVGADEAGIDPAEMVESRDFDGAILVSYGSAAPVGATAWNHQQFSINFNYAGTEQVWARTSKGEVTVKVGQ